jgi:hypothetical protein
MIDWSLEKHGAIYSIGVDTNPVFSALRTLTDDSRKCGKPTVYEWRMSPKSTTPAEPNVKSAALPSRQIENSDPVR